MDTNTVDDTHMVTAEAKDVFGNAVPDALVRFSVAAANAVFGMPTSGSATTAAAWHGFLQLHWTHAGYGHDNRLRRFQ